MFYLVSGKVTRIVATCGGDCVCFIDSGTGSVLKRYKKEREQFYALAWTTLSMAGENDRTWKTNILAVGCKLQRLYFNSFIVLNTKSAFPGENRFDM